MLNKTYDWLLKEIPLPSPPAEVLDLARIQTSPVLGDQGNIYAQPYYLDNWDGKSYSAPRLVRSSFDNRFTDWIKENITTEFQNAGVMTCEGNPDTPSTGAHTDKTRDIALIYTVLPGGDNTSLAFWQEKDFSIIRDRGVRICSDQRLDLISEHPTPINSWYLLNVRVLHSVEHLSGKRVNLQISFESALPRSLEDLI